MAKTNLDLIQEMFESKLNSLNEKIDTYNKHSSEMLYNIDQKVTKTNGTVIRHEQDIKDINQKYSDYLLVSATKQDIEKIEQKIEKINEENFIVKVLNRYPKAFITIIIVTLLLTVGSLGYSMIKFNAVINDIKQTEIPK